MLRNHHLAKSIADASWTQFRTFLVYYARVYGRQVIAVPPNYTSRDCSNCGRREESAFHQNAYL